MRFDSAGLLRMVLFAQTEAALLGHDIAAEQLEAAAQVLASELMENKHTVLSDEIFRVVEAMAAAKAQNERRKSKT